MGGEGLGEGDEAGFVSDAEEGAADRLAALVVAEGQGWFSPADGRKDLSCQA